MQTHCHADNLNGLSACLMFNKIIAEKNLPQRSSSDNDPIFQFHRWKANLRILEIEEIKSLPYLPMSHPFIERLIRIFRNEILDHSLFYPQFDPVDDLLIFYLDVIYHFFLAVFL